MAREGKCGDHDHYRWIYKKARIYTDARTIDHREIALVERAYVEYKLTLKRQRKWVLYVEEGGMYG